MAHAFEPRQETSDPASRFRFLFDSLPLGVIYHDASGAIVEANPAAIAMLGLSRNEALGSTSLDSRWQAIHEDGSAFPGEDHPVMRSLRTGKPVSGEVVGIHHEESGARRWLLVSSVPLFDGSQEQPSGAMVTASDITDRVEARAAERASRELFTSLFESMSEGVALHELVYDESGNLIDYRIIDTNPNYETNVGIPRSAALGRLATELYGVSPAPYMDLFVGVALSGKPAQFETYFPPLDKHFVISVAPLGPGPTGARRFATIFFDVSERRKSEAERERLLEELEAKNAELESIVYVASHDLRSPLVNIQGFSTRLQKLCAQLEALLEKNSSFLPPEEREAIRQISGRKMPQSLEFVLASARKMDELIGGLLRLSRTGRVELKPELVDMEKLMKSISSSMAFQLEKAGGSLELGELPPCWGDAEQISQVFSNLIDNAIKYRSPDRALRVRVEGVRRGSDVLYSVEDNGIGIGAEHRKKIWELFYRLNPEDSSGGEGLGLTLVKRIVERHRGKAWVDGAPRFGSLFYVKLPAESR